MNRFLPWLLLLLASDLLAMEINRPAIRRTKSLSSLSFHRSPGPLRRTQSARDLATHPKALSNLPRFMGYHGVSMERLPTLQNGLRDYKSPPNYQLGPGLYTGNLETAKRHVNGGRLFEVYATNYSNMRGFSNWKNGASIVPWTPGIWERAENQKYLKDYDFIVDKYIVFTAKHERIESWQIKFNQRAFSQLSFKEYQGP